MACDCPKRVDEDNRRPPSGSWTGLGTAEVRPVRKPVAEAVLPAKRRPTLA